MLEPVSGATGVLTFEITQLDGLDTLVLDQVKQLTLSVVTRVTDTIGANLVLTNLAAISYYDSQPGLGPDVGLTPTQRSYVDGISSAEHRTPDVPDTKDGFPGYGHIGQRHNLCDHRTRHTAHGHGLRRDCY